MGRYDGQVWGSGLLSLSVRREGESGGFIVVDYSEIWVVDEVVDDNASMIGGGWVPWSMVGVEISCDNIVRVVEKLSE